MTTQSPYFKYFLRLKENWYYIAGFVGIIVSAFYALSGTYLLFSPMPSDFTVQVILAYVASLAFYLLSSWLFNRNAELNEYRKIFNTLHYLDSKIRLEKLDLDSIKKIFFRLDFDLTSEHHPFFNHLKWAIVKSSDNTKYFITHVHVEQVYAHFLEVFLKNPGYRVHYRDILIKLSGLKDTQKIDQIVKEINSDDGLQLGYTINVDILGSEREKSFLLKDLLDKSSYKKKN